MLQPASRVLLFFLRQISPVMNDEVINLEDELEPAPKYDIVQSKRYKKWLKKLPVPHKVAVNTEVIALARGDFDRDTTKYKRLRHVDGLPIYEIRLYRTPSNPAIRVYCYQDEETDTVIILMHGSKKDDQKDVIEKLLEDLKNGDYDEYIPSRNAERAGQ